MDEPEPPQSESGPSNVNAGNSDNLNTREEQHFGDIDLSAPSPEPPACTTETRQSGQRVTLEPDPLEQEPTDEDPGVTVRLPNLQTTQEFINALKIASLETSGMQPEDIESLRDPSPVTDLKDPPPLLRSLRHFINNFGSSQAHYEGIREIELLNDPSSVFLSFDQAKRQLLWLSGVVPLEHDMCPNSCVAYTGPYAELNSCP